MQIRSDVIVSVDDRRIVKRNPESVEKRILDAAQAEFMRVGYDRASTNTMARTFGISKATIFRYFPTKRHLLEAVVARVADRWRDHVGTADPAIKAPHEWLRLFAESTLLWLLRDDALFAGRMAIAEGTAHPEIRQIWSHHATEPILAGLADRFSAWQATGEFRRGDPGALANAFFDLAITGHVSRALYGEFVDRSIPRRTIETAVAIFLHGSATPAPAHK